MLELVLAHFGKGNRLSDYDFLAVKPLDSIEVSCTNDDSLTEDIEVLELVLVFKD
jgi:hypothetical protein